MDDLLNRQWHIEHQMEKKDNVWVHKFHMKEWRNECVSATARIIACIKHLSLWHFPHLSSHILLVSIFSFDILKHCIPFASVSSTNHLNYANTPHSDVYSLRNLPRKKEKKNTRKKEFTQCTSNINTHTHTNRKRKNA